MKDLPQTCPVEDSLRVLSGKWRLMALFKLGSGPRRFNELQRSLLPVTQKVLTTTLRGMEQEGLVWRRSENTVPPHVTYGLTERGKALGPVFTALVRWQLDDAHAPAFDFNQQTMGGVFENAAKHGR